MIQSCRLSQGGRINRDRPIHFRYDNREYQGYEGDTLASALLANGVHLVGRSFKYHRPRGIHSAGSEEANALVQLESGAHTEPNRRATEVELYEGLCASSQNCWPSVRWDVGAINARLSRLLPAGFYYKTFMWPARFWMTYEKYIRRAAGLGQSSTEPDPDHYDKLHAHCDVLVVGGGPAGLQAALSAGRSGARVILTDEKPLLGGSLLSDSVQINHRPAQHWIESVTGELDRLRDVTVLTRTTVTGYYDYNFLVANERVSEHLGPANRGNRPKERLWKIRAHQVILATGAIERPLVFADNDRPGIMLAGALRTWIHRFAVLPGRRVGVLTNNDSAYQVAREAIEAGAFVEIIDVRKQPHGTWVDRAQAAGISIRTNATVTKVRCRQGRLRGVSVMELSDNGRQVQGQQQAIQLDLLVHSGGWTPTVHLFSQGRGSLQYLDAEHCFVPGERSPNNRGFEAGACKATWALTGCLTEGASVGAKAAQQAGFPKASPVDSPEVDEWPQGALRPLWILPTVHPIGRGSGKHFHDLQNDATVADIHLAAREGFFSVEHLKRYTTTGMGTDQGKTSNLNALTALADIRQVPVAEVGVTTFRPPYTAVTFGSIVGHDRRELFLQQRKTAIHPWHESNGAVFEDVGDWKRPFYFPRSGESMHEAVQRECRAVRTAGGLLDASTLGKIDIRGKDALWLLNQIYTNAWDSLKPGGCRYGLMLNEHGMVFDDGVTTCLQENHYHMTTTTGGAARVMSWLEEWLQTEWTSREVYCTSVTEQWAVVAIAGPQAQTTLATLTDHPLDEESFPFMTLQEFPVAGIPARIFRISFTGEPSFEINVKARYGLALWEALLEAGQQRGVVPYGTETMHILRAEKGYIIVGQETDGTVTPMDLGMDWIISKKKGDFLGRRSHTRTDTAKTGRKQLVGLLTEDPLFVLPEGTHIVEPLLESPPMNMLGHVTSSYLSPNVGRSIAMALIKDGFRRKGETLSVALMDGNNHPVTVTDPVFLR